MSANNEATVNQVEEISSNDHIDQPEIIELSDSDEQSELIVISDSEDIPETIVSSDTDDTPEIIEISDSPEPEEYVPKCAVCWEPFSKFGVVWKTNCGHIFCRKCLIRIFIEKVPCPLCREPLGIATQKINTTDMRTST